jgi:hypothetical protein
VEPRALTAADPELGRLFLSGLWFWLRALSFGLLYLLRGLTAIVGNHGLAIIALAVCVKLLLFPLTKVAERLQEQVNATQARLQPGLDAINAAHRGRSAHVAPSRSIARPACIRSMRCGVSPASSSSFPSSSPFSTCSRRTSISTA